MDYQDENCDPRALWMDQWEVFLRRELNFCVLRSATSGNLDRGLGPMGGGEEWQGSLSVCELVANEACASKILIYEKKAF